MLTLQALLATLAAVILLEHGYKCAALKSFLCKQYQGKWFRTVCEAEK